MDGIKLLPITKSNYNDCVALKVREDQMDFVASNAYSLVQAAYESDIDTLGIYVEDRMIGFILYDIDEELKAWSMSRYMIDERYQGKGYGKEALRGFIDFFQSKYPKADQIYTSANVNNPVAIGLYESMGFQKEEVFSYMVQEKTYHEIRMKLKLQS